MEHKKNFQFSDLAMSKGRGAGSSGVNEMLGSLLSNVPTGRPTSPLLGPLAQEALGSLLSTTGTGRPQPSGPLLPSSPLEVAQRQPPISPLLIDAGKILFQNWQPILQVRSINCSF